MREPGDDDDLDDEGPMVPLGEVLRALDDARRLGLIDRPAIAGDVWPEHRTTWLAIYEDRASQIVAAGQVAKADGDAERVAALRERWRRNAEAARLMSAVASQEDFDNYWRTR